MGRNGMWQVIGNYDIVVTKSLTSGRTIIGKVYDWDGMNWTDGEFIEVEDPIYDNGKRSRSGVSRRATAITAAGNQLVLQYRIWLCGEE